MKKLGSVIVGAAVLTMFAAPPAFAAPSAKFTAEVNDVTCSPASGATATAWVTVLSQPLKTPNKKDLLIGASFETGLFTQTKVKGKHGDSLSSNAEATLKVRVLVDGGTVSPDVEPDEVVYDRRAQTLNAVLGGVIESCEDTGDFSIVGGMCVDAGGGPDGTITIQCECTVTDEEIELILDTLAAHHFNFVARNLPSGSHTISVQTMISSTTGGTDPSLADAKACVGRGSLTVEEVRATNNPEGIDF